MMDGLTIEIYIKSIEKGKEKVLEWSLKTVTIVGTGKSIDFCIFVYLLRLAITPYCP